MLLVDDLHVVEAVALLSWTAGAAAAAARAGAALAALLLLLLLAAALAAAARLALSCGRVVWWRR